MEWNNITRAIIFIIAGAPPDKKICHILIETNYYLLPDYLKNNLAQICSENPDRLNPDDMLFEVIPENGGTTHMLIHLTVPEEDVHFVQSSMATATKLIIQELSGSQEVEGIQQDTALVFMNNNDLEDLTGRFNIKLTSSDFIFMS